MNKCTVALTTDQYKEIISTMKKGFTGSRPNEPIATALMLEANLGLRISDVLRLRLSDIVKDGERYRLAMIEQKTGKARTFTVPLALYQFIRCYCLDHTIPPEHRIFPLTERTVQRHLQQVCDYLGICRYRHPQLPQVLCHGDLQSEPLQHRTGTATAPAQQHHSYSEICGDSASGGRAGNRESLAT